MSPATAPARNGRSVLKGAFQGTIVYSIPLVGQRLAGILILSVVTRVLTAADVGMISLLDHVCSLASILLCNAFSSALGYFYYQEKSNRSKVIGTSVGRSDQ